MDWWLGAFLQQLLQQQCRKEYSAAVRTQKESVNQVKRSQKVNPTEFFPALSSRTCSRARIFNVVDIEKLQFNYAYTRIRKQFTNKVGYSFVSWEGGFSFVGPDYFITESSRNTIWRWASHLRLLISSYGLLRYLLT